MKNVEIYLYMAVWTRRL